MRLTRRFLIALGIVAAVVALLIAIAFSSPVQTWYAERVFAQQPGTHATFDMVSAGWSTLHVEGARIERDGHVLTVPLLDARLPVITAFWHRKLEISSLVAKHWTLDLSHEREAPGPAATAPSATGTAAASEPAASAAAESASASPTGSQNASARFAGLIPALNLPPGASLNGLELEGDVLLPIRSQGDPVRVHVTASGGGVATGHDGDLTIDATTVLLSPNLVPQSYGITGRGSIGFAPDGALRHVAFTGNATSDSNLVPTDLTFSIAISKTAERRESYDVSITRSGRKAVSATAEWTAGKDQLTGTWQADVLDSDVTPYVAGPLPLRSLTGEGRFTTDLEFRDVHVSGDARGVPAAGGPWSGWVQDPASMIFAATFAAEHASQALRFDQLDVTVGSPRPTLEIRSLQSFTVAESTGVATPSNAAADWVEVSARSFPLSQLARPALPITAAKGVLTGRAGVRVANGIVTFRAASPVVASGVSLAQGDRVLAQGIDLGAMLTGEYTKAKGWTVHTAPLTVESDHRPLLTANLSFSPLSDAYRTMAISGNWIVDLAACAASPGLPALRGITARSASGDITANLGAAADVTAKFTVVGHDPKHLVSGTLGATIDDYRAVTFKVPLKIAFDSKTSDVAVEGSWSSEDAASRLQLDVTTDTISADQLRLLAKSLPLPGGGTAASLLAAQAQGSARRDPQPFWGNLLGRIRFDAREVQTGSLTLDDVGGTLGIESDSIRLNGGRATYHPISVAKRDRDQLVGLQLEPNTRYKAEGTLAFDPKSEAPYHLEATGGMDGIDGAKLFGAPPAGREPVVEGRWIVDAKVTSTGANLPDLIARRREELKLTSDSGTLRLLKTSIAESLPDKPTPVADTFAGIGSAIGTVFGTQGKQIAPMNRLPKEMEAMLNFTYQVSELGYDKIAVTADRGADGVYHLHDIFIDARNEHLTGTGELAYVAGRPLNSRPIHLNLRLSVRGVGADRLATANLLEPGKNAQGFRTLNQTLHFTGTLAQIDSTQWHDLLLRAAQPGTHPGDK